jgi:PRC-barrel domain
MAGEATDPASVYLQRAIRESEDFLVESEDGTKVGVVDKVILDDSGGVAAIEVGVGWLGRRRWTFGAADVVAVLPARRRLYVSEASLARVRDPAG